MTAGLFKQVTRIKSPQFFRMTYHRVYNSHAGERERSGNALLAK